MTQFLWPAVLVSAALLLWPRSMGSEAGLRTIGTARSPGGTGGPLARIDRWRAQRKRASSAGVESDLLDVVEALTGALRAGLPPATALTLAAGDIDGPLGEALATVGRRAKMGDGLAVGWAEAARRLGSEEMALLARAWSLSEEAGTPLAEAAHTAGGVIRDQRDQRERTRAAVAGAKATMTLLTVLPAAGPFLGLLMGLDMTHVYATSPVVWVALGAGVALVLVGRWWMRMLIDHTLAGPVLR